MAVSLEFLRPDASHASIYVVGGATPETMNATPGTFNKLVFFTTNGHEQGYVDADAANDRIQVLRQGHYVFTYAVSMLGDTTAETYELAIYAGPIGSTVIVPPSRVKRYVSAGGTDVGSLAGSAQLDLNANDVVELWGTCTSTGSKDLTIVNGSLNVIAL